MTDRLFGLTVEAEWRDDGASSYFLGHAITRGHWAIDRPQQQTKREKLVYYGGGATPFIGMLHQWR